MRNRLARKMAADMRGHTDIKGVEAKWPFYTSLFCGNRVNVVYLVVQNVSHTAARAGNSCKTLKC